MSYKIDLSDLKRDGAVSLTQQLADRFAAAIESGELEPGEKLPPTRELAELVGVNHLTAARVYRRLAGARLRDRQRRPRHLRAHAGARRQRRAGRRLADLRAARARAELLGAGARGRDVERGAAGADLAGGRLAVARASIPPTSWRASPPTCSRRRAATRSPTCPPRACTRSASSSPRAGAGSASPTTPTRSSSPRGPSRASASPRAPCSSRATWRWWSRRRSPACSTRSARPARA